MKNAVALLAAVFCTLAATAQQPVTVTIGNGISTREVREIAAFNKISVFGPFEVRLVSGNAGKIVVEAEKNLTGLVSTEVEGNVLTIKPQDGKLFKSSKDNKIIIKVPFETINEIAFKGSGTVSSKKQVQNDLVIKLEGSGSIDLNVASNVTEAILLGSGNITIGGKTQTFKCKVVGPGVVKAQELQAAVVDVSISGSGNAEVHSNEAIKGRISGSGNVAYTGSPRDRDLKRTGTGEFKVD